MSPFWPLGQLVVCVDTDWLTPPQPDERFPARGDVLTIGDIDPDQGFAPGEIGFRFEECVPCHGGFLSRHFRPARLSSNDALRELRALQGTGLDRRRRPHRIEPPHPVFFVAVRCASSTDGSARSSALGASWATAPRSSTSA